MACNSVLLIWKVITIERGGYLCAVWVFLLLIGPAGPCLSLQGFLWVLGYMLSYCRVTITESIWKNCLIHMIFVFIFYFSSSWKIVFCWKSYFFYFFQKIAFSWFSVPWPSTQLGTSGPSTHQSHPNMTSEKVRTHLAILSFSHYARQEVRKIMFLIETLSLEFGFLSSS